jgi:hypothetical protein
MRGYLIGQLFEAVAQIVDSGYRVATPRKMSPGSRTAFASKLS